MEASKKAAVLALFLVLLIHSCNAMTMCNVTEGDLKKCKAAVTPPNPAKPTASCCAVLKRTDLKCLCSYKNSPQIPSLGIDLNLALQLPKKCNIPHAPC